MYVIVSSDSGSIPCRSSDVANESIGVRSGDHPPRLHVLLNTIMEEDKSPKPICYKEMCSACMTAWPTVLV